MSMSQWWHSASARVAATALVLLALLAVFFIDREPAGVEGPLVCEDDGSSALTPAFTRPLEDIALTALDGTPVMLHALAGEALTVVLFCSYRCPCSDGYVDRLRELQEAYRKKGVNFIAIDANVNEHLEGLAAYAVRKEYPLPLYLDDLAAAADAMNALVTPEAFVFDAAWELKYHGRIDDDKSGLIVTDATLQLALDTLLRGAELSVRENTAMGCAIVREAVDGDGEEQG